MDSKQILAAFAAVALVSGSAHAVIVGQLGVLDDGTNGGINPATGAAWAPGDVYRLAFVTSTTRNAQSPDIADYHAHVQAAANASPLGLGGTTWNAILQTWNDQDRNVNAYNNGSDVPIILLNSTLLAENINDLNNGPQVAFSITEDGVTEYLGAVASGSSRKPGDPNQPKIEHGASDRTSTQWWQVYNGLQESQWHFYAISYDLTVQDPGVGVTGDFDGDGDVDGVDVATMFSNFNGPGGGVPGNPDTDLDNDGDCDGVDVANLFGLFTGPLAPATVPEPTSFALIGLGGLLVARRRRD